VPVVDQKNLLIAKRVIFLPHDTDWAKIDNGTVFDVPIASSDIMAKTFRQFNSEEVQFDRSALILLGEIAARLIPAHRPASRGEGLRWIARRIGKAWFD